jgi:hypothetical protein
MSVANLPQDAQPVNADIIKAIDNPNAIIFFLIVIFPP